MAPSYISADDILLLNDDLTEVTGSAEHAVTSTNIGDVHEAYRRHLAGKVLQRHNKAVKLRELGPILTLLESEVKKGPVPLHQIEER